MSNSYKIGPAQVDTARPVSAMSALYPKKLAKNNYLALVLCVLEVLFLPFSAATLPPPNFNKKIHKIIILQISPDPHSVVIPQFKARPAQSLPVVVTLFCG